jgi:hypothetical protein
MTLFPRRRWAGRLLAAAGIDPKSPLGRELTSMILSGASACAEMVREARSGERFDALDFVFMSARAMEDGSSAVGRLRSAGVVEPGRETAALAAVREAADRLYAEAGRGRPKA